MLDAAERERFRRQAEIEGQSLSAWLRDAGRERLEARRQRRPATRQSLRALFKACDAREKGREPDWEQHLAVMKLSRARGTSGS